MIDMFNIPVDNLATQVFYFNGSGDWQTWSKPSNAKHVYFFVLGGGSGGGGGRTVAANSSPGGGGGASAGYTVGLYQASLLPDILYLQVGKGGEGGAANTAGSSGEISYVSVRPDIASTINIFLQSSAAAPTGGGGAFSTTGVGAGGTAATIWDHTTGLFGELGIVSGNPGQNGTSGTGTGGTVNNITPVGPVTGGAGGGAVSGAATGYNGGSILGTSYLPQISSGTINAADLTINGKAGTNNIFGFGQMPMFFLGGSGGGSATTAGRAGGNGGNGGYGCGGGGGAGTYNGTGGSGGKGGDGLIMIVCV